MNSLIPVVRSFDWEMAQICSYKSELPFLVYFFFLGNFSNAFTAHIFLHDSVTCDMVKNCITPVIFWSLIMLVAKCSLLKLLEGSLCYVC